MNQKLIKNIFFIIIIIILSGIVSAFIFFQSLQNYPELVLFNFEKTNQNSNVDNLESTIYYNNYQYRFVFNLPSNWQGFSVIYDNWDGYNLDPTRGDGIVETGPLISIRHPKWTPDNKRQDIPILVFSINQWNDLKQAKFHIGAAPIGPKELGRNSNYVFALPARYNYAFLEGFEEVEEVLVNNSIRPY